MVRRRCGGTGHRPCYRLYRRCVLVKIHAVVDDSLKPKTKTVDIDGTRYQLRRMGPDVGSFILMKFMGAMAQRMSTAAPAAQEATEPDSAIATNEDIVRGIAVAGMSGAFDLETHSLIQRECLMTVSRLEDKDGTELPMPIMNSSGAYAVPEVKEDIALVLRLQMEALVFNLSSFFEQGGLNALAEGRAASA